MKNAKYRWRVDCWEYERGWGRREMGTSFFDSETAANEYVADYNKDNTADEAPDCYFTADSPRKVMVDC